MKKNIIKMEKNIIKKLFLAIFTLSITVFYSCQDQEFTKEELLTLKKNADALVSEEVQVALNNDGKFASLIVQLVSPDNKPAAGVNVNLTSATTTSSATETTSSISSQDIVTDEKGIAFFPNVIVGGNIITISGEKIITYIGNASIGSITYNEVKGEVIPKKVSYSAIIPVWKTDGLKFGTVKGIATIETNLINETKEFAEKAVVRAHIDTKLSSFSDITSTGETNNSISITSSYFQYDNKTFGVDTVDALGNFELQLPALANNGTTYTLKFDNIEKDQVIAISYKNGVDLDKVKIDTVKTVFGNSGLTRSDITQYLPIHFEFSAPPAQGSGLKVNFARRGRYLHSLASNNDVATIDFNSYKTPTIVSNTVYQLLDAGEGYKGSPDVTITDPTGDGVLATAYCKYNAIGVKNVPENGLNLNTDAATVTATYPYYPDIDFILEYKSLLYSSYANSSQENHNKLDPSNPISARSTGTRGAFLTVRDLNGDYILSKAEIDTAFVLQKKNSNNQFIGQDNYFEIAARVATDSIWLRMDIGEKLRLYVDYKGVLSRVYLDQDVRSYVETENRASKRDKYTAPIFTFSAGGATRQASVSIKMATPWTISLDNSNVTSNSKYLIKPAISFEYYTLSATGGSTTNSNIVNIQKFDKLTNTSIGTVDLLPELVIKSDGTVGLVADGTVDYVTTFSSYDEPTASIISDDAIPAKIYGYNNNQVALSFNTNNGISSFTFNTFSSFNLISGTQVFNTWGSGYNSVPTVKVTTIEGASGSGLVVKPIATFSDNGEATITSLKIINPGSNYTRILNYNTASGFNGSTSVIILADKVVNIGEVHYGTGSRIGDVR